MKILNLVADPTVQAVRREYWVSPDDVLVLAPVVMDGPAEADVARGPWGQLFAHDGAERRITTMLMIDVIKDPNDDWVACGLPPELRP